MKLTYLTFLLLAISVHLGFSQVLWSEKSSLPATERERTFSFAIGDVLYVGGGRLENGVNTNEFWAYDTETDTWTQKADYPGAATRNSVGFSDGQYGFMGMGFNGTQTVATMWQYNPDTDTWTMMDDFPGGARNWATGISSVGKGYIAFGGDPGIGAYNNDIWEYTTATNSWEMLSELPGETRYRAAGFLLNDKLYLGLGGKTGIAVFEDFWEYDLVTDVWTQMPDLITDKSIGIAHFRLDSRCYILFGSQLGSEDVLDDNVYYFDTATNTWNQTADFIGEVRSETFHAAVNGKGYVGSGAESSLTGDVYFNDLYEFIAPLDYVPFSASSTEGCTPFEVNFTDEGTAATSWEWTFEGAFPSSSIEQNPTVVYNETGTYDVSLLVNLPNGYAYTAEFEYIVVDETPLAAFTANEDELTVEFINQSVNADNYNWDFGDGNNSTDENPVHTYASPGTYTVTLSAENQCGPELSTAPITVISTGTSDPYQQFNLLAMPNPFDDQTSVTYQLPGGEREGRIRVFNWLGQVVFTQKIKGSQAAVLINNIEKAGVYFLQFEAAGYYSEWLKLTKIN